MPHVMFAPRPYTHRVMVQLCACLVVSDGENHPQMSPPTPLVSFPLHTQGVGSAVRMPRGARARRCQATTQADAAAAAPAGRTQAAASHPQHIHTG